MRTIEWAVRGRRVPFYIGCDCSEAVAEGVAALEPDIALVVTDEVVASLHGGEVMGALRRRLPAELLACRTSHGVKSLGTLEHLALRAVECGASKRSVIVALGGGAVGNLAGVLSGLLFRGIRLVHVPTTLVAMHDSVTSAKQAVDCLGCKNLLGLHLIPSAVYCDVSRLRTLPRGLLLDGIVELGKNALILGGAYAADVEQIISASIRARPISADMLMRLVELGVAGKYRLTTHDPDECSVAIAYKYGHTVGHAMELASQGHLSHGESVWWGMLCAALVSRSLRLMSDAALAEHQRLLLEFAPERTPERWPDCDEVLALAERDSRRETSQPAPGELHMVLLRGIGELVKRADGTPLTPVPLSALRQCYPALSAAMGSVSSTL